MDSLVADGSVDEADLEAALLATVACVEAAGSGVVARIEYRSGLVVGYSSETSGGSEQAVDAADAVMDECSAGFISPIYDLYRRDHPIPQATLEQWREEDRLHLVECLQGLGFEVDSEMTDQAIEESVERMAFLTCSG